MSPASSTGPTSGEAIARLEAELAGHDGGDPLRAAVAAYRLAVALSEANPANARRALRLLQQAGAVLTEAHAPIEHGRVLTASAAQHRVLGDSTAAAELFERAARVLERRASAPEAAAAWSNVGLARGELGEASASVEAFDRALALLDDRRSGGGRGSNGDDGTDPRITATALVNRGQALFALGRFDEARADLERALDRARGLAGTDSAPVQVGLAHHSLGQIETALGRPAAAIGRFEDSLRIFTRRTFPGQHAVALFNLGVAHAAIGEISHLRRALWCFEGVANLFDPRLQVSQWREAARRLDEVARTLDAREPGRSRADHRAALLAASGDSECLALTRELFDRFAARPEPYRTDDFAESAAAAHRTGTPARTLLDTALFVLAELPDDVLQAGLAGQVRAHALLDAAARHDANVRLDEAIQHQFQGPQRVRFRDGLYALGWERP